MAATSGLSSHPNPNPNPTTISPMLQPYLEQQQQQERLHLDSPPDDGGSVYDFVPGSDERDNSRAADNNPTILSTNQNPSPINLLHVSFNQDYSRFATGTNRGFRIFSCDPFREIFHHDFDGSAGGIGAAEMLFRCNILALVGGGDSPQYSLNKVMIWDDNKKQCIRELTFKSEVRGVRLRRDRIIAVLERRILVYNFVDLKLLHQIETIANPKGLCAVSHVAGSFVLVCPGLQKGQVRVEHYASTKTKFITAHDSRIASLALSQDGNMLATASSKGTLVRIYNTHDGSLLQEVRISCFCCVVSFVFRICHQS